MTSEASNVKSDLPQKQDSRQSLISPLIDFLMVGGLFLPIFVMLLFSDGASLLQHVTITMFYIPFIINYPHFMHSYQILYDGFRAKLTNPEFSVAARIRYWVAGIISPIVLVAFMFGAFFLGAKSTMGLAMNVMYFLVGWHYVKQGYGALIVLSVKREIFFNDAEKRVLLSNAYSVWLLAWVLSNSKHYAEEAHGIPFESLALPLWIVGVFLVLTFCTSCLSLFIFVSKSKRQGFPVNGAVAYFCALYPWVLLGGINIASLLLVSVFHGLQYLPFAWKLSYEKYKEQGDFSWSEKRMTETSFLQHLLTSRMCMFLMIGYASGALSFYVVPTLLDYFVPYDHEIWGQRLFTFMFLAFINIHHYFIDFAIWRKENPEMRYLFR